MNINLISSLKRCSISTHSILRNTTNIYKCSGGLRKNSVSLSSSLFSYNNSGNGLIRSYSKKNDDEASITFTHNPDHLEKLERMDYDELKDYAQSIGAYNHLKHKESTQSNLSFQDKLRIKIKAGDGGAGCVSFFRAKYIPEGPPDGGNGGKGASVIIRADFLDNNLSHLERNYIGENGEKGKGGKRGGKNGEDIIIRVPPGTIVKEVQSYFADEEVAKQAEHLSKIDPTSPIFDPELFLQSINEPVIEGDVASLNPGHFEGKKSWRIVETVAELNDLGEEIKLLEGGLGGKGNVNFATGRNRSPEYAQPGLKGDSKYYELELKIIADIGLVGYPNAGKSTFLSRVSNATPKIRSYAFTTLHPYVGVLDFPDDIERVSRLSRRPRKQHGNDALERQLEKATMADLPGILEGAALDIGLGLDFLKHIERTKVLCFVIDMSNEGVPAVWDGKKKRVRPDRYKKAREDDDRLKKVTDDIRSRARDIEQRTPWGDYITLLEELESYQSGLSKKPSIIIANKMDNPFAQDHLEVFKQAVGHLIPSETSLVSISSATSDQDEIDQIKRELKKVVKRVYKLASPPSESSNLE